MASPLHCSCSLCVCIGNYMHLVKRRQKLPLSPYARHRVRTHTANDAYIDAKNTNLTIRPEVYRDEDPRTKAIWPVQYFLTAVEQDGPLPAEFLTYTAYEDIDVAAPGNLDQAMAAPRVFLDGKTMRVGHVFHRGHIASNGVLVEYNEKAPVASELEPIFDEYELSQKYHPIETLLGPDYEC